MNKLLSLTLVLVVGYSAHAQKLILQPQVGIRNFEFQSGETFPQVTTLSTSPSAGARLIYQSKKGHGPYLGFHVNSLIVNKNFGTLNQSTNYTLTTYEAGYQWMSKPVYFKRIWDNNLSRADFESLPKKGWAIQFNPNVGISYTRPLHQYYNTAVMTLTGVAGLNAGMGFIFSKNGKQLFSLVVNYTKGITGDLYYSNRPFSAAPYISTKGSGFNIGIGVPINLLKKK